MIRHAIAALAAVALTALAGQASAHAHLTAAEPAANGKVAAPKAITLHFSEKLEPKFSGAELVKADGAKVAAKSAVSAKDRKTIVATPDAALAPGAYMVTWHVVSADGHKMKGDYNFTVQ